MKTLPTLSSRTQRKMSGRSYQVRLEKYKQDLVLGRDSVLTAISDPSTVADRAFIKHQKKVIDEALAEYRIE